MGAKSDKEEAPLAKSKASPKKAAQRWMLVDHAPWNPWRLMALLAENYGSHGYFLWASHIRSY